MGRFPLIPSQQIVTVDASGMRCSQMRVPPHGPALGILHHTVALLQLPFGSLANESWQGNHSQDDALAGAVVASHKQTKPMFHRNSMQSLFERSFRATTRSLALLCACRFSINE